jgi:polyphosphate glucokinase
VDDAAGGDLSAHPLTLAIDIGGTGLKAAVLDREGGMVAPRVRVATPERCPPETMVAALLALVAPLPAAERISIGFPGVVRDGLVRTAPHFGNAVWSHFPLEARLATALGKPARLLNDAEVQGLAVIQGQGIELVVTLGTGAGTALFRAGALAPHLELAHHPIHKDKTYNDYLGQAALEKVGTKRWNRRVRRMIGVLDTLVLPDTIYLGGGNAAHLKGELPEHVRVVSNQAGLTGGVALWTRSAAELGRSD